jgi:protein TonB
LPPPPPPPEPEPAKPPPPPPPKAKQDKPPPPPPEDTPLPPPPAEAPSEPAPEAPTQKIYTMPGPGQMVVPAQPETGSAHGRPKTTGEQVGGSTTGGTGQSVSVAAIKTMPKPTGDYDYVDLGKDYPEAARRQGIEGEVTYRIFVDETGKVTQVKVVKGVGFGLDEKGAQLIRRIKFEPARDTNDRAVGVWRSWSIQFTLPR